MTRRLRVAIILSAACLFAGCERSRWDYGEQSWTIDEAMKAAKFSFDRGVVSRGDEVGARQSFRDAAREYHKIPGAAARRMECNCWLLGGEVPRAIEQYHEALREHPNDELLWRGLEYGRTRVAYASPEDQAALTPAPETFSSARRFLRGRGVLVCGLLSVVAWIVFARWIATRRPGLLAMFLAAELAAVLVAGTWLAELRHRRHVAEARVVVLYRGEILRRGDGPTFQPSRNSPLPVGVEMKLLGTRGLWHHVELADGTTGWIPATSVIDPTPP